MMVLKKRKTSIASSRLLDCKTQEVKALPENISPVVTTKDSKTTVTVAMLNPGEHLQVSALTSNPEKLVAKPLVQVRGKGVVGETKTVGGYDKWVIVILVVVWAVTLT